MFILPLVRDHLSWETTQFSGTFIQDSLYHINESWLNVKWVDCIMNTHVHGFFDKECEMMQLSVLLLIWINFNSSLDE